jgi:hypothetical protein
VVGVADVGFIVVGFSEEGDKEVGLFENGGRELGDMEVGLFENGGVELGDMEVGVAVPSLVGKGVGGVEMSMHSPNDFVSVDWNSPPEMAKLPSTSMSYEPKPWPITEFVRDCEFICADWHAYFIRIHCVGVCVVGAADFKS